MKLYVIERHHQLLELWKRDGAKQLSVTHIDFHCDLRGLMIDVKKQVAYRIKDRREGLDEGNFLRHAFEQNIVDRVTWVHGLPGGRKYDVHTVKHLNDFTSIPHRLKGCFSKIEAQPFGYDVQTMDQWEALMPNQFLDIDWDTFADATINAKEIEKRIDAFLAKDFSHAPIGLNICYSPYHSHDSRERFEEFVSQVAEKFSVSEVETVPFVRKPSPKPLREKLIPKGVYDTLQSFYHNSILQLKKIGLR